jgi:hypothetical protein
MDGILMFKMTMVYAVSVYFIASSLADSAAVSIAAAATRAAF